MRSLHGLCPQSLRTLLHAAASIPAWRTWKHDENGKGFGGRQRIAHHVDSLFDARRSER